MTTLANCTPWGNVLGLRVDGAPLPFETSLRLVRPDWSGYTTSEKYNWIDPIRFTQEGRTHVSAHALKDIPLAYTVTVTEQDPWQVVLDLQIQVSTGIPAAGLYFCVELPAAYYQGGRVRLLEPGSGPVPLAATLPGGTAYLRETLAGGSSTAVVIESPAGRLEITPDKPTEILLRQDLVDHPSYLNDPVPHLRFVPFDPLRKVADYQLYFTLASGPLAAGQMLACRFILTGAPAPDTTPVRLALDPTRPGRRFDGISGNFRLQFPEHDPKVIEYCLDNLRVTWGRIAMWWEWWHPDEDVDPLEQARAGRLPERIYRQMEIARELARRGIPVIVSAWGTPDWVVSPGPQPDRGVRLDEAKLEQIGASITAYLTYLKQVYGVEAAMFSFNETDVGVEVRQTPEEHNLFTKTLGRYFAQHGLATKMLLGDTGHGTAAANRITGPAVADGETHEYVGAVGLHTWHGCTPADLAAWKATADALNVPLMAIEGGPDSAAHRYPQVFLEPWFQLRECDLYIRICAGAQVSTMMEWQFTSDYSLLTGDGIYGTTGPLRPTWRFWLYKQLGSTPAGAFWLPLSCDRPEVSCAAYGQIARGEYAVHLVNNGAARKAILTGLPEGIKALRPFITDAERGMQECPPLPVVDGTVEFDLDAACFLSLFGEA